MQKIGDRIALLIRQKGYIQKDFAQKIGYNAAAFSRALSTDNPGPKMLDAIANGLEVSVDFLRTGKEAPDAAEEPYHEYFSEADQE